MPTHLLRQPNFVALLILAWLAVALALLLQYWPRTAETLFDTDDAMRLVQIGLECYFIGETITPIVKSGDLVVIVSNTGSTMSAVQTANIARRVGAGVLSITGNRASKLSQASNVALAITEVKDARRAKYAPLGTLFETASLILLDGIVAHVMKELGETEASMRSRHAIMV